MANNSRHHRGRTHRSVGRMVYRPLLLLRYVMLLLLLQLPQVLWQLLRLLRLSRQKTQTSRRTVLPAGLRPSQRIQGPRPHDVWWWSSRYPLLARPVIRTL